MHPLPRFPLSPRSQPQGPRNVFPSDPVDTLSVWQNHRERLIRALEQTRQEIEKPTIPQAVLQAANELERNLVGLPSEPPPGQIMARVVAAGVAASEQPPMPLEGLTVKLALEEKPAGKATSSVLGLVQLPLPQEKEEEGDFLLEVLAPDGEVLLRREGHWRAGQPLPALLLELPRTDQRLSPQIERALPVERAILEARRRASIAGKALQAALMAQERQLSLQLEAIETELLRRQEGSS